MRFARINLCDKKGKKENPTLTTAINTFFVCSIEQYEIVAAPSFALVRNASVECDSLGESISLFIIFTLQSRWRDEHDLVQF